MTHLRGKKRVMMKGVGFTSTFTVKQYERKYNKKIWQEARDIGLRIDTFVADIAK